MCERFYIACFSYRKWPGFVAKKKGALLAVIPESPTISRSTLSLEVRAPSYTLNKLDLLSTTTFSQHFTHSTTNELDEGDDGLGGSEAQHSPYDVFAAPKGDYVSEDEGISDSAALIMRIYQL